MRYRVVRPQGSERYCVQTSWFFGLFRDYERDFSIFWPPMPGRPRLWFNEHAQAQAYIDAELAKQRDKGQKWPWQPGYY